MKRNASAAITVLALVLAGFAQNSSDLYKGLKYDKSTETTIVGVVEQIEEFDCPASQSYGSHVVLKTPAGQVVIVHTAPVKFTKEFEVDLKKGDKVEVIGSMVKDAAGADTLIARAVTRENDTFHFRDKEGKPIW